MEVVEEEKMKRQLHEDANATVNVVLTRIRPTCANGVEKGLANAAYLKKTSDRTHLMELWIVERNEMYTVIGVR